VISGFLRFSAFLVVAPGLLSGSAFAAEGAIQPTNWHAVLVFLAFVLVTLGITYWAAQHTRTTKDFYAAGATCPRSISPMPSVAT
jgi:cation/acetate symporter